MVRFLYSGGIEPEHLSNARSSGRPYAERSYTWYVFCIAWGFEPEHFINARSSGRRYEKWSYTWYGTFFLTAWGSNPDVCICTSREGTVFDMGLMGIESGIRNDKCFGLLSFVNTFHFLQKSNVEGKFFLIQLLFIPQMYSL